MPIRTAALASLAGLLALGCATTQIAQDFDYRRGLPSFRSFYIMQPPLREVAKGDPRIATPFAAARIERAIASELILRGFEPAGRDEADILVGYHFDTERRLDVRTVDSSFGFRRRGISRFGTTQTRVFEYAEGTLIIDLADRESMMLAWRGWGSARLGRRPTPERTAARIHEIVPEILEQLPPPRDAIASYEGARRAEAPPAASSGRPPRPMRSSERA